MPKQKPHRFLLYLGLCLLQGIVHCVPRSAAQWLARRVAWAAFLLLRRERERTLLHLSWAFGEEKRGEEIRDLAGRVFTHFGEIGVDVLRFSQLNRKELARLIEIGDGFSRYDEVLSAGKGAVLLTAHFGNWELMGALFRLYGYQGAVVGRQIYYERYNQAILDLRGKVTLDTIYHDASPREFLRVLGRNEILGILADQDIDRVEGIFIPFFGRPAYTLTSPVRMALSSGAPIVPTFLVREGRRYRLIVDKPFHVEMRGSREETIREYTVRWSRIVEEKIRAYPEQWAWMHRRWKTIPKREDGVLEAAGVETAGGEKFGD